MVILTEFQAPESPILHEQRDTRALLDNTDLGLGTLYVSERTLCWKEPGGVGFCIEYPHISMHAITTDPNIHPTECIFIMIDGHISLPGVNAEVPAIAQDNEGDTESEPNISQLLLVPPDSNAIRSIYSALSQCQVLNPDPDDMNDEEENVYEDAEDYQEESFGSNGRVSDLGAGGDTEMTYLSARLRDHSIHTNYACGNGDQNFDDDQFEDAD